MFEQGNCTAIDGSFIRVDKARDLPVLHAVENFAQEPVYGFAVTPGREIKIDRAPPAVNGTV